MEDVVGLGHPLLLGDLLVELIAAFALGTGRTGLWG